MGDKLSDAIGPALRRSFDDTPVHLTGVPRVVNRLADKKRGDRDGVRDIDHFDGPAANPPIDPARNPDWLNERLDRDDLEPWEQRVARGQEFNYQNHHRYPHNEVRLANGKRLDSYVPDKEIVSRKHTQLDSVKPETAKSYIDEILKKYPPGTPISGGGELRGDLILEVPVQGGSIPQLVIDHANGKEPQVIIRDVLGNEYN